MQHIRRAPCHPMTQGKIERWHQTLKNRIQSNKFKDPELATIANRAGKITIYLCATYR
jgi:transposase InsO family protein